MKILVFSDSHGETDGMERTIREYGPDMVLHLGDHARDAEELCRVFPALDIRFVRGNCDYGSSAPESLQFSADGVNIYMTHGHRQNVKFDLLALANTGHFAGARLCLFGHTHQSEYKDLGELTLFNPGSCGMGRKSCGLITAERGAFQCRLLEL